MTRNKWRSMPRCTFDSDSLSLRSARRENTGGAETRCQCIENESEHARECVGNDRGRIEYPTSVLIIYEEVIPCGGHHIPCFTLSSRRFANISQKTPLVLYNTLPGMVLLLFPSILVNNYKMFERVHGIDWVGKEIVLYSIPVDVARRRRWTLQTRTCCITL